MTEFNLNDNDESIVVIDERCQHNVHTTEQMKRDLIALAREKGLEDYDIAAKLDVGVDEVKAFEHYSSTPKLCKIYDYAKAIGARVDVSVYNEYADMPEEDFDTSLVAIARFNKMTHEVIGKRMAFSVENVKNFENSPSSASINRIRYYANAVGARLMFSVVSENEQSLKKTPFKICQLFHSQVITKEQLIEKLKNYSYVAPDNTDGYDSLSVSYPESWDEVSQAVRSGLISSEIYEEVFNFRHQPK